MQAKVVNYIEEIKTRICELQKDHVSLQEQFKKEHNNHSRFIDNSALRIIDILDMIEMTKLNVGLDNDVNSNGQFIIKKIEKRLTEVLKQWQVQEIIFQEGIVEAGKARVLETQKILSKSAGTIIEVCRKGYQRDGKTIRPADVITVE